MRDRPNLNNADSVHRTFGAGDSKAVAGDTGEDSTQMSPNED